MSRFVVDESKCRRDGICAAVCPVGILEPGGTSPPRMVTGGEALCISCGHCVAACPYGACSLDGMATESCPPVRPEWHLSPEQAEHFLSLAPLDTDVQGAGGGARTPGAVDPGRPLRALGAQRPAGALARDQRPRGGAGACRPRGRLVPGDPPAQARDSRAWSVDVGGAYLISESGFRALGRATWRPDRHGAVGLEVSSLDASENAYRLGRLFGSRRFGSVTATLDLQGMFFDQPVNGQTSTLVGSASVGYPIARGLTATLAASAGVTSFYHNRFDVVAKLVYQNFPALEVRP